jgi:hypothetical protein
LNKGSTQKTPDATVQKTEEAIKAMSLQAPPPLKKVEKIDVLKAYSESNAKENINFVVVGEQHLLTFRYGILTPHRPR